MTERYEGMDLNYFVGYQDVFKCKPEDRLEYPNNQFAGKHLRALSLKLALTPMHSSMAKRTTL